MGKQYEDKIKLIFKLNDNNIKKLFIHMYQVWNIFNIDVLLSLWVRYLSIKLLTVNYNLLLKIVLFRLTVFVFLMI